MTTKHNNNHNKKNNTNISIMCIFFKNKNLSKHRSIFLQKWDRKPVFFKLIFVKNIGTRRKANGCINVVMQKLCFLNIKV